MNDIHLNVKCVLFVGPPSQSGEIGCRAQVVDRDDDASLWVENVVAIEAEAVYDAPASSQSAASDQPGYIQ